MKTRRPLGHEITICNVDMILQHLDIIGKLLIMPPMVANNETIVHMIMDNIAPPTKDKAEEQQEYVVVESASP